MKFCEEQLKLYAVTDSRWLNGRTMEECVTQAIEGGATMIQLREKELDLPSYIDLAQRIKKICEFYQVPLIINDSLEVALKSHADGIHVGQDDIAVDEIRKRATEPLIIGKSVTNLEEAKRALSENVDYFGVGSLFPTETKGDACSVSLSELKRITALGVPVCTIGGIHLSNIDQLVDYSLSGIALVSEIFRRDEIKQHTQLIKNKIESIF